MASIGDFETTIKAFQAEFNELATELQASLDVTSSLASNLLHKLDKINEFIDRTIVSKITDSQYEVVFDEHPNFRSKMKCIFDDEVRLRMALHFILELNSNLEKSQLEAANQDNTGGSGNGTRDTQTPSSSK